MRWVKTKKEIDSRGVTNKQRKICYHEFKSGPTPDPVPEPIPPIIYIDKDPFYHWVTYTLQANTPPPNHPHFNCSQRAQENYEIFCGGWLQFYDIIFKGIDPNTDPGSRIYFVWRDHCTSVTIYIDNKSVRSEDPNAMTTYHITFKYREPASGEIPEYKETVTAGDPPDIPAPPPPSSYA